MAPRTGASGADRHLAAGWNNSLLIATRCCRRRAVWLAVDSLGWLVPVRPSVGRASAQLRFTAEL